ncbi:LPXTG cell wall anchor domain-containing protein [Phytohabitans suffuscus]|uniref:Gram-positive cocci surface proteins LPxTG domain-containing protein n=1 Tax=Phytohabitans suffuscus TaxID=624315 RepID=A0A6F8Y9Y4_9ACTN|nr:LPXTG cell wall anchor domain-containing protein [Phytohabitans suffuscus]BCB82922.1 hypothetical protein Psuf_002350 [Phytohabitans suffuscus]
MRITLSRVARLLVSTAAASAVVVLATQGPASAIPIEILEYPTSVPAGGTITVTATCGDEHPLKADEVQIYYSRVTVNDHVANHHINTIPLEPGKPEEVFTNSYDTSGLGTPQPGDRYTVTMECWEVNEVRHVLEVYGPLSIEISGSATPKPSTPATPKPSTPATPTPSTPSTPTNPAEPTNPGEPSTTPADNPAPGGSGPQLPVTGSPVGVLAAIGVVLLLMGALGVVVARRRAAA